MISGYFGLPGCGKTSFLTKIALDYVKKGYKVYCNIPIPYTYKIAFKELGKSHVSNGIVLLDEVTLDADSRDYKQFNQDLKQFFILHRHYHLDIVYFTQQYDGVDRKIRELTACLYYVRSYGQLTIATRVDRFIHIDKERRDIMTGYKLSGIISILFFYLTGSLKFCYRPLYYQYFNSYDAPQLNIKEFDYWKCNLTNKAHLNLIKRLKLDAAISEKEQSDPEESTPSDITDNDPNI